MASGQRCWNTAALSWNRLCFSCSISFFNQVAFLRSGAGGLFPRYIRVEINWTLMTTEASVSAVIWGRFFAALSITGCWPSLLNTMSWVKDKLAFYQITTLLTTFTLWLIITYIKKTRGTFLQVSLIFKKAFDSIWQERSCYTILQSGLGDKLYDIIKSMYVRNKCGVKTGNTTTDLFTQGEVSFRATAELSNSV